MKLLFDQNLRFKLCRQLEGLFPGSMHVGFVGLAKATDIEVWEYAKLGEFALVSLDSDFAELAALLGPPPKFVWLRCGNTPTAIVGELLRGHLEALAAFEADAEAACMEIY
jgi:predicted nuclease of predicted toxin-antitoxin system